MPPVVPCPRPTDIWPLAGTCPARSPFGRWAGGGNPLLSVESLGITKGIGLMTLPIDVLQQQQSEKYYAMSPSAAPVPPHS